MAATAGVLVAGCLTLRASEARAEDLLSAAAIAPPPEMTDTWVCTDAKSSADPARLPLEFSLTGGILSEQPFGVPRYRLLANTAYAIIGEDHYGDFDPVLGTIVIFVSTVVIDKTTGGFTTTTSLSDSPPRHRMGHCRRFEQQIAPAIGSAMTHR